MQVLSDDFLCDVSLRNADDLRALRDRCQAVETALSYLRRLAQGRLDIVNMEVSRRQSGGDPQDLGALIDALPEVLSDRTRGAGSGFLPRTLSPGDVEGELADELATMEVDAQLTNLPQVSDAWLEEIRERLVAFEARVSALRHQLHERIDRLQDMISERYRSGEASVDALIRGQRAV